MPDRFVGPSIFDYLRRFRSDLLRDERQAASEMVRTYGASWQRIQVDLRSLTDKIRDARRNGERVSPAWLFQQDRLGKLRRQVEAEIGRFAAVAESSVRASQSAAVTAALQHAPQLIGAVLPPQARIMASFSTLARGAVEDLIGFSSNGSPLARLFVEFAGKAAQGVRQDLINGVVLGEGPRKIASRVRSTLGGQLDRALLISRTEVLRSYREATHRSYQESEFVDGWTWSAAVDGPRCCPVCWSMHGRRFPMTQRLASHPACRCTAIPVVNHDLDKEIGIEPFEATPIVPGRERFAKLTPEKQDAILGLKAGQAYRAGEVELQDFVGSKRTAEWGLTRYTLSLKDAIARADRRPVSIPELPIIAAKPALTGYHPATDEDRKRLKIPPAWSDVRVSDDPKAARQAMGKDKAGRPQSRYSDEHTAQALRDKFERNIRFMDAAPEMWKQVVKDHEAGSEEASVLRLIFRSGFRNGGETDTLAKVKAFGANTLERSHVSVNGDIITFDFPGKKGVRQLHDITDPDLAADIKRRLASEGDRLFHTSDTKVLNYLRNLQGSDPEFKVHDVRTWVGTTTAADAMKTMPIPTTAAEFKVSRDKVGQIAARKLGDTLKVTLETYVNPMIFERWAAAAGVAL